jgi:hypothetical protein
LPSALFKPRDIFFGVSTAGALQPQPHVDVADRTSLDQRAELILADAQPARGSLAVHQLAHQPAFLACGVLMSVA